MCGREEGVLQAVANGDKTILLVEDDVGIRETLAEILQDECYEVLQAGHGRAAWIGEGGSSRLLTGFTARFELEKCRGRLPGRSEDLRLVVEDLPRPSLPPRRPALPAAPAPAREHARPLLRVASA